MRQKNKETPHRVEMKKKMFKTNKLKKFGFKQTMTKIITPQNR